ncbi:MAG: c-type cytochrome [bacterium]|jgi:mono/diheme cytochrome c family protein|nr:c-type cytochrome [bacterium]
MLDLLLTLDSIGLLVFFLAGLLAVTGRLMYKEAWHRTGLLMMAIVGPITLFVCYEAQEMARVTDAVFWGRLMAGDVSKLWGLASLGLIAGSGLAVGALALNRNALSLYVAALFFASAWLVLLQHPTPHYVPIPNWLDKLIWLGVIVGGAGVSVLVFQKFREQCKGFLTGVTVLAGGMAILSAVGFYAKSTAQTTLSLETLESKTQITALGCLSCHTMDGKGYEQPGGALESVSARTETALREFLLDPSKESAEKLGIRNPATGEMAGIKLTPEQVDHLVQTMVSVFEVQPPSSYGEGGEQIEVIFKAKSCMDCHSFKGDGAPNGGLGGPLENAAKFSEETLVSWLKKPSAENAKTLGIRTDPFGAMEAFALNEEEAAIVAKWLKTLTPNE